MLIILQVLKEKWLVICPFTNSKQTCEAANDSAWVSRQDPKIPLTLGTNQIKHRDQRMCQVVPYKRLKQWKIIIHQAQKVVMVAYRRCLLTRGSKCKAWTGKILAFCIGGRLWEVVTDGGLTV